MPATKSGVLALLILLAASPALAHTGNDLGGFTSGILHPITGLEHVIAMIAIGLWGSILGNPSQWLLPVTFPLMMAVAAAAGVAGLPLPGFQTGIAVSGIVLGLLVLAEIRLPVAGAMVIVACFAVFHGYAHGAALPSSADPLLFAIGFVIATGALHLTGIAFGMLRVTRAGRVGVRATGGVIALLGAAFLTGIA